jgi:hypothetical protein
MVGTPFSEDVAVVGGNAVSRNLVVGGNARPSQRTNQSPLAAAPSRPAPSEDSSVQKIK